VIFFPVLLAKIRDEIHKATKNTMNDYGNVKEVTIAFDKLHQTVSDIVNKRTDRFIF
jgi:hypothetical protein